MSDLMKISRALDDQSLRWRISGAVIRHARDVLTDVIEDGDREAAARALAAPQSLDPAVLSLVVSDPAVITGIEVDDAGAVSTSKVPDDAILAAVRDAYKVSAT